MANNAEIQYAVVNQHDRDFDAKYSKAEPIPYEPPKRNHIGYEISPFTRQPTGAFVLNDKPLALNSVIDVFDTGAWIRCKVVMTGRTMFAKSGNGFSVTISPGLKCRWATEAQARNFLASLKPPTPEKPPYSVWFDGAGNRWCIVASDTREVVQEATSQDDCIDLVRLFNVCATVLATLKER